METSSTAMFMYSYIKGVENGWLNSNEYLQNIQRAWSGLKNAIDFDGLIRNIIGETGIHDTSEDYEPETTKYCDSAPGLGAVLRAVAAIVKFNNSLLV